MTLLAAGCDVKVVYPEEETTLKPINILAKDTLKTVMAKLFANTSPLRNFRSGVLLPHSVNCL
jgi:hypothetical protein